MRLMIAATLAALAGAAQAQDAEPGRVLVAQQFRDMDADADGLVTGDEFLSYGDLAMVSMDSDESGDLVEQEFISWGFGMHNLVDEAGTRQGFDTAMRVIFDYWDRSNDQSISPEELSLATMQSFEYSDASGDRMLDESEFLDNFLLNIALSRALTAATE